MEGNWLVQGCCLHVVTLISPAFEVATRDYMCQLLTHQQQAWPVYVIDHQSTEIGTVH